MKKSISVVLLIAFTLLTLFGCNNTDTPTNTPDDTDNDPTPAFVDVIKDYDKIDDSSTEGFTVKAKKYDYEENNLVLLSVENQTENNYTVTVDMTYYDDGGNEITKESQSFEGFAANWQKYFLFKPDKAFSSYEYKLTTENFSGECLGNKFTYKFAGVKEDRGVIAYDEISVTYGRIIYGSFLYSYDYPELLGYKFTPILFDNKGDLFSIVKVGSQGNEPPNLEQEDLAKLVIGTKDSVEWPEELKGETTGILVLEKICVGILS